jgi:preprotein translocase subunit SecG
MNFIRGFIEVLDSREMGRAMAHTTVVCAMIFVGYTIVLFFARVLQ